MKKSLLLFVLFCVTLAAYPQKYVGPRDLVPGSFIDERDQKTYSCITIGGKI